MASAPEAPKRRLVLPQENTELRILVASGLQMSYAGMSRETTEAQAEVKRAIVECHERVKSVVRALSNRDEAQLVAGLQQINSALPALLTAIAAHDLVEPRK